MAIRLWSYDPDKCDGVDYCRNDCDLCPKAEIDEEHIPIELAMAMLKNRFKEQANEDR